jgi:mono/diheme cytochrome c family protein
MLRVVDGRRAFPPEVATYATKLACELPDEARRSLSLWTCGEIARTLKRDGVIDSISAETIRRMLASSKLKPWRVHHWLSAKVERNEAFRVAVAAICDLYTRKCRRSHGSAGFGGVLPTVGVARKDPMAWGPEGTYAAWIVATARRFAWASMPALIVV